MKPLSRRRRRRRPASGGRWVTDGRPEPRYGPATRPAAIGKPAMPTTLHEQPDGRTPEAGDAAWAGAAWALTLSLLAWLWVA